MFPPLAARSARWKSQGTSSPNVYIALISEHKFFYHLNKYRRNYGTPVFSSLRVLNHVFEVSKLKKPEQRYFGLFCNIMIVPARGVTWKHINQRYSGANKVSMSSTKGRCMLPPLYSAMETCARTPGPDSNDPGFNHRSYIIDVTENNEWHKKIK